MDTIKLKKGIIYLMLPFRLESKISAGTSSENSIWIKTDEDLNSLDFLLEHVREFFSRNHTTDKEDESTCILMKLKTDSLPVKMFNNKVYWLLNKPFNDAKGSDNTLKLPVYFDPGSFRIIYHPFTGVAILVYSIEQFKHAKDTSGGTLADFIRMNYLLRTFNRHDEAFFISQNDRTEERSKALHLLADSSYSLFTRTETGNVETDGWRPWQLINYLLNDLNKNNNITFFDSYHFFPVSYLQGDDEIRNDEIVNRAMFFLSKVYDFDFVPSTSILKVGEEILHPFKQIYYATSLEGASVFNNCSISDPVFIITFYSNSFKRSLWLAILGLLQRSVFLQLLKEVSDVNTDDHKKVKEYLKKYTTVSLKAIFSKVSIYHQHNDFYDLIIRQLQINELQTEIKDELYGLNNLLRQFHEDEVERFDGMEKQFEKKFNLILFALSVFSLIQVTYQILGSTSMSVFKHLLAIGIPLILGVISWQVMTSHRK